MDEIRKKNVIGMKRHKFFIKTERKQNWYIIRTKNLSRPISIEIHNVYWKYKRTAQI